MTTSNSSSTDEVGTTSAASTSEQTATNDTVAKIDYTRLQSESTKWRQNEIDMAIRLVSKDKSELNTITDAKLRDAVVKATSSYSSYDEMVAIEGNEFSNSNTDEDSVAQLQKQLKQLSYQNDKREMEGAIAKVKAANPDAFKSTDAEEKLREELKYLSSTIPVEERVAKAAKLAFANSIDSTTLAFKAMATSQPTNTGSTTGTAIPSTAEDKNLDDMLKFLKIRK